MTAHGRPGFGAGVRAAAAPLFVWAAHFAFCYVAAATGCPDGGTAAPMRADGVLQAALVGATLAAAAVLGWMLWRGCRARGGADDGDSLVRFVRPTAALLSLAGVAWAAVPLLLLPACP